MLIFRLFVVVFFFKQKTAYEMRISDWSSDVCSSDLKREHELEETGNTELVEEFVQHAEKIKTERVMGTDYSVWDVHTNLNRWWVITNPPNLYSPVLMPSLDSTLSFHIGLMARVQARREIAGDRKSTRLHSRQQCAHRLP